MSACGRDGNLPKVATVVSSATAVSPAATSFEAIYGATVMSGQFSGGAYEIEVPSQWNGELVLSMHGGQVGEPQPYVEEPTIRRFLIRNGYAWAAASYDSTKLLTGVAADQTAALRDLFASMVGKPQRAYVIGASMGGGGALISAERYPDKYDGALALCEISGASSDYDAVADVVVAVGLAAGISQQRYDSLGFNAIFDDDIVKALNDGPTRERFRRIWADITGGVRPFASDGIDLKLVPAFSLAGEYLREGLVDNTARTYRVPSDPALADANSRALRFHRQADRPIVASDEFLGGLQMPTITLDTTGDGLVPISEALLVRDRVSSAGKSDLLVQRAVQAPDHCGFSGAEIATAFVDLVRWVKTGQRPSGELLAAGALQDAGKQFTMVPRLGSAEADALPGASGRVTVRGNITLDGAAYQPTYLAAVVLREGLVIECSFEPYAYQRGEYALTVAAEAERSGCGSSGSIVRLVTFDKGRFLLSKESFEWPPGRSVTLDASFASSDPSPQLALFVGDVVGASGINIIGSGTVVATVGAEVCGLGSFPKVGRLSDTFRLFVVGPALKSGCTANVAVSLSIDGTPESVEPAMKNVADGSYGFVDIIRR